ncbi:STAS domain-containing protein [Actinoallomurus sp. NPDC052308]|uniref:STAS domain-containing protein n=1 Tax=Actinoallomurus sp. NPDC052308 TaxID=3155530 RepID=UPI003430F232
MAEELLTSPSASNRAVTVRENRQSLGPLLEAIVQVGPGAAPVVSLRGELDLAGADAFEELVLTVILSHGPDVVIDAAGLAFCDARGLGALVRCANEARRTGGRLTLARPSHRLRRLMRVVDLDRLLYMASVPEPR